MDNITDKNQETKYLTKRILKKVTKKGLSEASDYAIFTADSIVVAEDGWIVRKHKNGKIQRIEEIRKVRSSQIVLD